MKKLIWLLLFLVLPCYAQEPQPKFVMPYYETVVHKLALSKLGEKEANLFITKVFSILPAYDSGIWREAIENKDWVVVRDIGIKYLPPDKIDVLISFLKNEIKPIHVPIGWVLWKGEYTITDIIPDGDIFLVIKDLSVGFEKLYDDYFNIHKGKTMVAFSWEIAGEFYIRQIVFQFMERYENKIYGVLANYGVFNSEHKQDSYADWVDVIKPIIDWTKSNTNLPVGITIFKTRDNSDDRFMETMIGLNYDFIYLAGLSDFNYEFGIEFGEVNRWTNGKPVILGGFLGSNLSGELPKAVLLDMSYRLPSFISTLKYQWKGLHLVRKHWDRVIELCNNRGMVLN